MNRDQFASMYNYIGEVADSDLRNTQNLTHLYRAVLALSQEKEIEGTKSAYSKLLGSAERC